MARRRALWTFAVLGWCSVASVLPRGLWALDESRLGPAELNALTQFRADAFGLDGAARVRALAIRRLVDACRGPHARLARQVVAESCDPARPVMARGAVGVLARLGDADALAVVERGLPFFVDPALRAHALRSLPAFLHPRDEAVRRRWMEFIEKGGDRADDALRTLLRQPPRPRLGRTVDPDADARRHRVLRLLAHHADPVAVALASMASPGGQARAMAVVRHYVGPSLGRDPARWAALWAGGDFGYTRETASAVRDVRRVILVTLGDLGADALPEVLDALRKMADGSDQAIDRELVLRTLRDVARAECVRTRAAPDDVHIRARHAALVDTVRTLGRAELSAHGPSSVRAQAALALASVCGLSAAGEDAGASRETVERLRRFALRERDADVREAVVQALADIGDADAVALLAMLLDQWAFEGAADARHDGGRIAARGLAALVEVALNADCTGAPAARAALRTLLTRHDTPSGASAGTTLGTLTVSALQRATGRSTDARDPSAWPMLAP